MHTNTQRRTSTHSNPDYPRVRRGCGHTYNSLRWGSCPVCTTTDRGLFALGCNRCRNVFYAAESVELCPECGAGDTSALFSPGRQQQSYAEIELERRAARGGL